MALPALSPEQRQAALQKARQARAARSDLLAGLKAGTLTLAEVLGRGDDLPRKTTVAQAIRARPATRQARPRTLRARPGIPPRRPTAGPGGRQGRLPPRAT